MFLDSGLGDFDSDAESTFGCEAIGLFSCAVLIPFASLDTVGDVEMVVALNRSGAASDEVFVAPDNSIFLDRSFDTSLPDPDLNLVFGLFSPSATVQVPEPSALFLFGAVLVGLTGLTRRGNRGQRV